MLDKRNSPRVKTVLPVKISTEAGTHLAHTVDITDDGAQVGGLRTQLQPGSVVSLRRGSHKAKFRIAWVRQLGPTELRIGIECLEPQNNFWEISRPKEDDGEENASAVMTFLSHCARTGW